MKSIAFLGLIASVLPFAAAQQTAWGQCGGIGWSESHSTVSEMHCLTNGLQLEPLLASPETPARS